MTPQSGDALGVYLEPERPAVIISIVAAGGLALEVTLPPPVAAELGDAIGVCAAEARAILAVRS